MPSSNLKKVIQRIADQLQDDPAPLMDKILPPDAKKILPKISPFLKLAGLPNPDRMLISVVQSVANLSEEFFSDLEYHLEGIIAGEEESTLHLLKLLGVVSDGNQH